MNQENIIYIRPAYYKTSLLLKIKWFKDTKFFDKMRKEATENVVLEFKKS